MNNNLLKINGEFVKFVVTADENVPNVLKNSGIITIVHDKNVTDDNVENKVNRNKIYIADEFVASGYGVRDEQAARKLQTISEIYDDAYSYLLCAYSYSTNYSTDLYNRILDHYVSNIGETSNTFIMLDDCTVTLSDIRKLFVPAQYDDFKINDTSYVQLTYNLNTFEITNNSVTTHNLICYSDKQHDLSDLSFNIPVGAHVNKVIAYFDINTINHNGVNGISGNVHTTKSDEPRLIEMNECYTEMNETLPGIIRQRSVFNMNFSENHNNITHDYIVTHGDNTPIENFSVRDAGSHEIKYYPLLERDGKNIKSTENFIEPYNIDFGNIHVNGNHMIYYYQTATNNSTGLNKFVPNLYNGMYNDDDTIRYSQIIDDETIMYYKASSTDQTIVFGIPSCYDIEYVYYYDGYFKENCTGDIYAAYTKNGSSNVDFYLTVNDNNANNSVTKIKYNLYRFKFRTKAYKKELQIHVKLLKTKDEVVQNFEKLTISSDMSYTSKYKNDFIQNELYNTMHWFTPTDLNYLHF